MKRRAFFARLAGAVAATAVAPSVLDRATSAAPVAPMRQWTSQTFTVGDTFTIQNHYVTNPPNTLQTYTVTAVADA